MNVIGWNSRDNTTQWILAENNKAKVDLSQITRIDFIIGGVTYSSNSLGQQVIWWNSQVVYNGQNSDAVKFKIGKFGLNPGLYKCCRMVVYDNLNPNGLTWLSDISITLYRSDAP